MTILEPFFSFSFFTEDSLQNEKKKLKIIYFHKKIYSLDLFYSAVPAVPKAININCHSVINLLKKNVQKFIIHTTM